MISSSFEVCQIRYINENVETFVDTIFANSRIRHYWIAEMTTNSGTEVIAKSKVDEWGTKLGLEEFE
jgi:hypothetical protein